MSHSVNFNEFYNYVHSFYGRGCIYDMDVSIYEIKDATDYLIANRTDLAFEGDSIDREHVRDIIINKRKEFIAKRRAAIEAL